MPLPFKINNLQPLLPKHPGYGYLGVRGLVHPEPRRTVAFAAAPALPNAQWSTQLAPRALSLVFNNLQIPPQTPSISFPCVFIRLQNPFPANPFLSHRYKTPGCHPAAGKDAPNIFQTNWSIVTE